MKRCIPRLGLIAVVVARLLAQREDSRALQPIAFSHKIHIAIALRCLDCHTIRPPGFEAGIPGTSLCMTCHSAIKTGSPEIKRLAEFHATNTPVPWVRVYRAPDFVVFSHSVHVRTAKADCATCHGPVSERDVITKENPITMNACVECHEKNKARTGCETCHDIH